MGLAKCLEKNSPAGVLQLDGVGLRDFGDAAVADVGGELPAHAHALRGLINDQVACAEDGRGAVALEAIGGGGHGRAQFAVGRGGGVLHQHTGLVVHALGCDV
jgi:hypothetical protein